MTKAALLASALLFTGLSACSSDADTDASAAAAEIDKAAIVDPGSVTRAGLEAAVSDDRVREFYEARDWQPAWTPENAPSIVKALRNAGHHGLDPRDYVGAVEDNAAASAREAALTKAAFDLADALADGRADPGELYSVYTFPRPEVDLAAGLERAAAENRPGEWIEGLAPQDAEYRALSEAYVKFAQKARQTKGSEVDDGDGIEVGESDPRVPQIAAILSRNGYLEEQPAATSPGAAGEGEDGGTQSKTVYTQSIADALKAMQRDFGIEDDGVIGPSAIEMLNTGAAERARLLAVNLERRRWYQRDAAPTRIDVNIASATLNYFRDGERRNTRNVVVGQPGWETPQLSAPMFRLVANPTWTVPKSIEREEMAGKGASYFAENNMVRRDGYIVQQPGPDNALGEVKFDLKNDEAIYLHDTPAVQYFDQEERYMSHGCIRVDDALQFAQLIAEDAGIAAKYRQAAASGEETFVDLPEDIAVRLFYHTAYTDPSGKVLFRNDPYGWDEKVAAALGYEARQPAIVKVHINDVGP